MKAILICWWCVFSVLVWGRCFPIDQSEYFLENTAPHSVSDIVIYKDVPSDSMTMGRTAILQTKDGPIFIFGGFQKTYAMMYSSTQNPVPLLSRLLNHLVVENGGALALVDSALVAEELLKQVQEKGKYRLNRLLDCSVISQFPKDRYTPDDLKIIKSTLCVPVSNP